MKICKSVAFQLLLGITLVNSSLAQTPSDALLMNKRQVCIAAIYQHDTWNQYWEGSLLRKNENVGTLTRNTFLPMLAYGVTNKLTMIVSLPYVSTSASGGQMVGADGWQDFSVFAKYKLLGNETDTRNVQTFVTAGFSTRASSYLSDYMPFSLGLGTQEFSLRIIGAYEYKKMLYTRASAAFLHRTTTVIERDYYYANGSHYSNIMDVPNATHAELALGAWLLKHTFQVELAAQNQTCLTGDDIRTQNSGQPTNKANFTSIATRLRYFTPFLSGFSLTAGYNQNIAGKNTGKSSILQGGITYQFNI